MATVHWIVVADESRARVFEADEMLATFHPLRVVANDHARHRHGHEDDHGRGGHHGAGESASEARADQRRREEDAFARVVADELTDGCRNHRFERLIVCAPPAFLGELRHRLDAGSKKRLVASVAHDWTRVSTEDLPDRVRKALPEVVGLPE